MIFLLPVLVSNWYRIRLEGSSCPGMWVLTIFDENEREKNNKRKEYRERNGEREQEKEIESERTFSQWIETVNLGGLDLSRRGLDQESRSRQFEKGHLNTSKLKCRQSWLP